MSSKFLLPVSPGHAKLSKNETPTAQKRTSNLMLRNSSASNLRLQNEPSRISEIEESPRSLGIYGTIEYELKDILEHMVTKLKTADLFHFTSPWGHSPVTFYFPKSIDWGNLFNPTSFLSAFEQAYGVSFDGANLLHTKFAGFKITIHTNQLGNRSANLTFEQAHFFRTMFCLVFGTILQVNLPCCACFPQTFLQWTAWQAGIKMNCISQNCSSWLETHSESYDSLFVGDCSQTLTQLALVNIGNITADTVTTNIKLKISTALGQIQKVLEESSPPSAKQQRTA